ncbi:PTS sugar transporter subunit IIA [Mycoplasma putrefaciens]|uniref:Ascorbate-specific PTS system EIIA component n=2 Tax=Mycoplasma putrefaciens TaxID=2123 RepID=M9WCU7_9MOLU|nr:PTS sugar transporter subunit IIA [Mycoplasma putrefaciens]AEM68761.1 PTS system, IIA component [Mycoplasma putrefaciens KS1]AGJ90661.1 Phosphotransferase system PTS, IIA component [Mycoplasma putrefaciens Mput9231]
MLFKKELIDYIDKKVDSWEQGVEIASQLLIQNGYVDNSYPKEIIKITKQNGPYYIVAPKIALLHLTPKPEWKENVISLTVFKEPIIFKNESRYHVNFCLALLAKDNSSHIDILQKFALLFNNQEFIEQLEKIKNKKDLELVLEKYDK